MNEWGGELFDPSTTPALRATPPVPGGELLFSLLHFIRTFTDRAYSSPGSVTLPPALFLRQETDQLLLSAMRYLTIATALLLAIPTSQTKPVVAPLPTFKEVTGPGPMFAALQRLPAEDDLAHFSVPRPLSVANPQ